MNTTTTERTTRYRVWNRKLREPAGPAFATRAEARAFQAQHGLVPPRYFVKAVTR